MKISIKTLKGELFQIESSPEDTVLSLKEKIQNDKTEFTVDRQKLIHAGKVLKDTQSLAELKITETDFIVCMVTKEVAKPKVASEPVQSTPVTPAASTAPTQPPVPALSLSNMPQPPAAVDSAPPSYVTPEAVQALVGMGFPENETKAALAAAMGNADLAYEYLLTGIPEHARANMQPRQARAPPQQVAVPAAGIEQLRQHPQFNALKQLVQQNPAALPQVLNLIGQQSPELLAAIHANNDAFVAMMNEPISATPASPPAVPTPQQLFPPAGGAPNHAQMMAMMAMLPAEQRAQLAQSLGMTPEQMQGIVQMISTMPPEQLQQMMGGMGGMGGQAGAPAGQNVIRLSEEEMASVNRLVQLGFTQQQAAQAFLACDRNEALAANLLLEGWGDDEGGDYGDGGQDDDMYH